MAYITKTALSLSAGLVILLLATSVTVADNVYRWVDDSGNVHYSQRPPQDRSSEVINTRSPRSFGQHLDNDSTPATPTTMADTTDNPADDENAEQENDDPPAVFSKDPEVCAQARKQKEVLMNNPIVRRDGKAMTIEEKNRELSNLEEIIAIHC